LLELTRQREVFLGLLGNLSRTIFTMNKPFTPPQNVKEVLERLNHPKTAVITGGMPYANGPLHLGHLAGAMVPPDIMARYMRMAIGKENVLFVSGNDDHGS